ncbi:dimethylnonatriene synthase-like [Ipomoea triloba]|uniref:dimethylnonatriene synthase-like n=1 Tax=Ipomoea triloba TaxID=35885 RepID=UPI00125D7ADC|nr:dimethylnonatriene synthase-like [Ipomoea triloba]
MEISWIFLSLTCLATLALLSKLFSRRQPSRRRLPPGPKPWPIIGNLHLLGPIPHQSFHSLSKKYGDLMLLKFGSRPVVVASSPEMAKQFLKTHDAVFASRPLHAGGKYTSYNYQDMTWAPYGPYWRQARRIYLNEVFSTRRLDSFEHIRVHERRSFLNTLKSLSGNTVFLKDHLSRFSLCTMSKMVLSNKYFSEPEAEESVVTACFPRHHSNSTTKAEESVVTASFPRDHSNLTAEAEESVVTASFPRHPPNLTAEAEGSVVTAGFSRHHSNLTAEAEGSVVAAGFPCPNLTAEVEGSSPVRLEDLQRLVDQWFLLNGAFNLGDWLPWLSFLDLQGYVKQMKELNRVFDRFHNIVLDDHMAKKKEAAEKNDGFVPKDMVDVLLQMAEDPNLEVKLTKDCVKGLVQDLLTGGTDSLAAAVGWAFQELMRKPDIIAKATEELDREIGRERWVDESDCSRLPYIEAIIKETFRLHPLGTMLAPHYAMEDCNVAGYDIAKGTTILVNAWSIGRDPMFWDDAEEFKPERFLNSNIDMDGQNFAFLPFGSGRRRCPGYSLGLRVVRATLANMLHGFTWKLPPDMKPEDISMEEHYGLTTHPRFPIPLVMEPRLPSHLYSQS